MPACRRSLAHGPVPAVFGVTRSCCGAVVDPVIEKVMSIGLPGRFGMSANAFFLPVGTTCALHTPDEEQPVVPAAVDISNVGCTVRQSPSQQAFTSTDVTCGAKVWSMSTE